MKKNQTAGLLILIVLFSVFIIYIKYNNKEVKTENKTIIIQNEGDIAPLSYETKVLDLRDEYVKYDVKYPYFKNANQDFNLKIENLIKSQAEDHKNISKENWQARFDTRVDGDSISEIPKNDDEKFSFFSEFKIVQNNEDYISFVLKYGGFSGGAHGYENIVSFNYDVKSGKDIELKNIFPNDSQYLNTLSSKSREYLKNQFATVSEEDKENSSPEALEEYINNIVSMIESGTEPKDENFSIFTFTKDKVKIYFSQYQVGPYVIGMPEFEMDRK